MDGKIKVKIRQKNLQPLTIKKLKKDEKSRKKVLTRGVCFGIINERQSREWRTKQISKKTSKKDEKNAWLEVAKNGIIVEVARESRPRKKISIFENWIGNVNFEQ